MVDWFDERKGYGFVDMSGVSGQVFLHAEVLERSGFSSISDGDDILCDIERLPKGLAVSKIHKIKTDPDVVKVFECSVVKIMSERGYGFVSIDGHDRDVFFHFSALSTHDLSLLNIDSVFEAEVKVDDEGRTGQVRRILRFL